MALLVVPANGLPQAGQVNFARKKNGKTKITKIHYQKPCKIREELTHHVEEEDAQAPNSQRFSPGNQV